MVTITREKGGEGIALFGSLPKGRPRWTAKDYRPRQPRHNAQVFADVWHRAIHGIDDEGLFEVGEGSAGTLSFGVVVECIRDTDTLGLLSEDDAQNAAAMVYHLAPDVKYG